MLFHSAFRSLEEPGRSMPCLVAIRAEEFHVAPRNHKSVLIFRLHTAQYFSVMLGVRGQGIEVRVEGFGCELRTLRAHLPGGFTLVVQEPIIPNPSTPKPEAHTGVLGSKCSAFGLFRVSSPPLWGFASSVSLGFPFRGSSEDSGAALEWMVLSGDTSSSKDSDCSGSSCDGFGRDRFAAIRGLGFRAVRARFEGVHAPSYPTPPPKKIHR